MIKKLLIVITGALAMLLMYTAYDFYNMRYVMRIDSFQDQIGYVEQTKSIPFWVAFSDEKDVRPFMNALIQYAKDHKTTVMLNTSENNNSKDELKFSLFTENNASIESIFIDTVSPISFDEESASLYYASDPHNVGSSGQIVSLDDKYFRINSRTYVIGTFMNGYEYIRRNAQGTFFIYADDVEQADQDMKEIVKNHEFSGSIKIENFFASIHPADSKVINEGFNKDIIPIIVALISIYLLLLCVDITRHRKEILIRRMHGVSVFYILKKKYIGFYLLSWVIFCVVLACTYLYLSWGKGAVAQDLLQSCFLYAGCMLLCFMVLLIPLYYYIKITTGVQNLKGNAGTDRLLFLNLGLKIAIIIVLLPVFFTSGSKVMQAIENNREINKHEVVLKNIISYNTAKLTYEEEKELFSYYMQNDGRYMDVITYYHSTEEVLRTVTDDENEIEACKVEFPFMYANANYLQEHTIKDIHGEVIDLKKIDEDTLLVPKRYEKEDLKKACPTRECKTILIEDTGVFLNYNMNNFNQMPTIKNPVIHLVTRLSDETDSDKMYLLLSEEKNIDTYKKELEDTYKVTIHLDSNAESIDIFYERNAIEIRGFLFLLCVYLLLFAGLIYQYVYICLQEMIKEIAISYMLGKSRWQRYQHVLLASILPYSVPLLIGIFYQHLDMISSITILSCFVLFEVVVEAIAFLLWERKNAANALKGESHL